MRIQVPFFDILIRKNGEIIIIIPSSDGDSYHTPIFSYNPKKELGILYRDENREIYFTNFAKESLEKIKESEFITFLEIDQSSNIIQNYRSSVVIDEKLK